MLRVTLNHRHSDKHEATPKGLYLCTTVDAPQAPTSSISFFVGVPTLPCGRPGGGNKSRGTDVPSRRFRCPFPACVRFCLRVWYQVSGLLELAVCAGACTVADSFSSTVLLSTAVLRPRRTTRFSVRVERLTCSRVHSLTEFVWKPRATSSADALGQET